MPYIEKLKALKEERQLTNAEIATLSNIPLATITRVFNGHTENPTFETFVQIAIALGASLDEIAGLKIPQALASPIESTLVSYAELLREKDERIREKDDTIVMLKEINQQERTQRRRTLWFLGCLVVALLIVLMIDILNGNIGYFRH